MARFVAKYQRYRHICKHNDFEVLAAGLPVEHNTGYTCEFRPSDVTDYEREAARNHFHFTGVPIEGAIGTPFGAELDPTTFRLSVWDSVLVKDPKLRSSIEETLRKADNFGHDFIEVARPAVPKPWPKYDSVVPHGQRTSQMVAKTIVDTVQQLGLKAEDVIAYERENQNRELVIEALEELLVPEEQVEVTA